MPGLRQRRWRRELLIWPVTPLINGKKMRWCISAAKHVVTGPIHRLTDSRASDRDDTGQQDQPSLHMYRQPDYISENSTQLSEFTKTFVAGWIARAERYFKFAALSSSVN